jgi:hypothetical protein
LEALVVLKSHLRTIELLAKNPIFLAKVVADLQLALVQPTETVISTNRNGSRLSAY